jgi:lysophospholipase L1-like esterase
MIPLSVYIVTIIVLLTLNYFIYQYGRKKGESDFMELLFAAGLMGKIEAFKNYNRYSFKGGIVFVGDSITQDFNVYEYFPNHQVYNRGIGGDTSKGVLTRLNESVYELKPKQVFLQIGTNDLELIDDGIGAIYQRIKQIVQNIKQFDNSIDIHLISVYPVNPTIDASTVGKRNTHNIQALNNLISSIEDANYIPLYDLLEKDSVLNPEYTLEGLHLNQKGYEVLREELLKVMQ